MRLPSSAPRTTASRRGACAGGARPHAARLPHVAAAAAARRERGLRGARGAEPAGTRVGLAAVAEGLRRRLAPARPREHRPAAGAQRAVGADGAVMTAVALAAPRVVAGLARARRREARARARRAREGRARRAGGRARRGGVRAARARHARGVRDGAVGAGRCADTDGAERRRERPAQARWVWPSRSVRAARASYRTAGSSAAQRRARRRARRPRRSAR